MIEPSPEPTCLDKVTAFVTRLRAGQTEILLFRHPTAGIQIPAGTVEEGESLESAVRREITEETGLNTVTVVQYLGHRRELPPSATHVVLHRTPVYSRPDPSSFDWAVFGRGIGVRLRRRDAGFAQITYEEGDRYPDPTYITYQITGWVPDSALADANRRHFFHLSCSAETPDHWGIFSDHHRFEPFWASLDLLPDIIPPQRTWFEFVTHSLGYRFSD